MQVEDAEFIDSSLISNVEKAIIEQKKLQIDILGLLETETEKLDDFNCINSDAGKMTDEFQDLI
jgi:hypothetical protein